MFVNFRTKVAAAVTGLFSDETPPVVHQHGRTDFHPISTPATRTEHRSDPGQKITPATFRNKLEIDRRVSVSKKSSDIGAKTADNLNLESTCETNKPKHILDRSTRIVDDIVGNTTNADINTIDADINTIDADINTIDADINTIDADSIFKMLDPSSKLLEPIQDEMINTQQIECFKSQEVNIELEQTTTGGSADYILRETSSPISRENSIEEPFQSPEDTCIIDNLAACDFESSYFQETSKKPKRQNSAEEHYVSCDDENLEKHKLENLGVNDIISNFVCMVENVINKYRDESNEIDSEQKSKRINLSDGVLKRDMDLSGVNDGPVVNLNYSSNENAADTFNCRSSDLQPQNVMKLLNEVKKSRRHAPGDKKGLHEELFLCNALSSLLVTLMQFTESLDYCKERSLETSLVSRESESFEVAASSDSTIVDCNNLNEVTCNDRIIEDDVRIDGLNFMNLTACVNNSVEEIHNMKNVIESKIDKTTIEMDETKLDIQRAKYEIDEAKSYVEKIKCDFDKSKSEMNQTRSKVEETKRETDKMKIEFGKRSSEISAHMEDLFEDFQDQADTQKMLLESEVEKLSNQHRDNIATLKTLIIDQVIELSRCEQRKLSDISKENSTKMDAVEKEVTERVLLISQTHQKASKNFLDDVQKGIVEELRNEKTEITNALEQQKVIIQKNTNLQMTVLQNTRSSILETYDTKSKEFGKHFASLNSSMNDADMRMTELKRLLENAQMTNEAIAGLKEKNEECLSMALSTSLRLLNESEDRVMTCLTKSQMEVENIFAETKSKSDDAEKKLCEINGIIEGAASVVTDMKTCIELWNKMKLEKEERPFSRIFHNQIEYISSFICLLFYKSKGFVTQLFKKVDSLWNSNRVVVRSHGVGVISCPSKLSRLPEIPDNSHLKSRAWFPTKQYIQNETSEPGVCRVEKNEWVGFIIRFWRQLLDILYCF